MLGFCLGAQIIGDALGAKPQRSPFGEVDILPPTFTEKAKNHPFFATLPQNPMVIHWHNDMPGLTPSAQVLAESEGCPRHIVLYGKGILGIQCHMEIATEGLQEMIQTFPSDVETSASKPYVQNGETIISLSRQHEKEIHSLMYQILNGLFLNKI